jgi:hypothetical protein
MERETGRTRGVRSKARHRTPRTGASFVGFEVMSGRSVEELTQLIGDKGNEIKELKGKGATKEELAPHIASLLALKEE